MKRELISVDDFFKDDLDTPELRKAYRDVLDEEIGEILKSLRTRAGLTQQVLAKRLGLTRSRIAQVESAEGLSLSLETLTRYCAALGCAVVLNFVDLRKGESVAEFALQEAPARDSEWEFLPSPSLRLVAHGECAA